MQKILIIQSAFIGDVILATALLEQIKLAHPATQIDFLVRKGNESLLANNPHIGEVLTWNKKKNKYLNLFSLIRSVRKNEYNVVYNLQRFAASGFITCFSKAKRKIGFRKNPLSFCYTQSYDHVIGSGKHEVERNATLLGEVNVEKSTLPKLYPAERDVNKVNSIIKMPYVVIAPASVWFTKQLPAEKWLELIEEIPNSHNIYLVGAKEDHSLCDNIISASSNGKLLNLCGDLSLLQTAALMDKSDMNYVNDSAPMHISSAMNAPTTAVYCSTTPNFGFGPLASCKFVLETTEELSCRPCGLHGLKECPKGHFKCALTIKMQSNLNAS